jgi:transglutaminase-like putative cysteine protease
VNTTDALARNTKAIRISLLVGGVAGQLAVHQLVSTLVLAVWCAAFVAVSASAFGAPLPVAQFRGKGVVWEWQWRQLTALALIVVSVVYLVSQLRAGDTITEVRSLAVMLVFVQLAHATALRSHREAWLGCCVVVLLFALAAVFSSDVTLLLPFTVGLSAICVTATLLRRGALLGAAGAASAGSVSAAVRSCVTPALLASSVAAMVFLAMPNSNQLHGRQPSDSSGHQGLSHASERTVLGLNSMTLDLRARGALSTEPVLSTPADAPRYWQGSIFDQFDGITWSSVHLDYGGLWRSSNTFASNGLRFQVPVQTSVDASGARTDTVTVLADSLPDAVLSPGEPVAYAGPGQVVSDADGAPALVDSIRENDAASYVVSSVVLAPSPDVLRNASGADPVDPKWTAVSPNIAPRVRDLATQLTAGASSRFDAVSAVENYLRANEKYNLDSPGPKAGDDAVDDFVFVSHQGFCEQFATAAVVMLRSAGVPARLVTGYAFGTVNPADPRHVIYRGNDAHAWVQVYYPGVGWVNSDPTASATLATSSGKSIGQRVSAAISKVYKAIPGGRGGALLIVVALVALAAGGGLALLWWRARLRKRRVSKAELAGAAPGLAAYLRLEAVLARAEQSREPGETLTEFAYRLGGIVATASEVASAMRVVERECYARESRRPTASESLEAAAVFDRLREAADDQRVTLSRAAATATANRSGAARS